MPSSPTLMNEISWLNSDRRRYAALMVLVAGGLFHHFVAAVLLLGVLDMFLLPPATQRAQDQYVMAASAVGRLHGRTGASGFVRTENDLLIRVRGETVPVGEFLERFPDANREVERLRAASDICQAFIPATDVNHLCVQWHRGDRVGGLMARVSLIAPHLAKYYPASEGLEGNDDLLLVSRWSADAALLDDWEVLAGPAAPPPPNGLVRVDTPMVAPSLCTYPTRDGSMPVDTYYTGGGFHFSTPCSRAGLDQMAGDAPRPVIDVLATRLAWDAEARPLDFDRPTDVFLEDTSSPRGRIIRPLRVLRDPVTLARRYYVVPDALIAEFDLTEFHDGRTIILTYASGRTVKRPIRLSGVR